MKFRTYCSIVAPCEKGLSHFSSGPFLFFIICFRSKHCRIRLTFFKTLSPPAPLRTESGLLTPESLLLRPSLTIMSFPENVLIGFLWQKWDIQVCIYTHFSGTTALLFTWRTAAFAKKCTKSSLSRRWRLLKQLTGFAPDASYMPLGIIFLHILFPNTSCTVENDMKCAIYNITPVYLCYEAVMLFIEFSK